MSEIVDHVSQQVQPATSLQTLHYVQYSMHIVTTDVFQTAY